MITLKKSCVLLLSILGLGASSFAEVDWSGSVSGQVRGSDSDVDFQLRPSLGVDYLSQSLSLQSDASTVFKLSESDKWPDVWESQNQLGWSTPSKFMSVQMSYTREEQDDQDTDVHLISEDTQAVIQFVVPTSLTLSHQLSASGLYRSRASEGNVSTNLDELSSSANYRLQWVQSARTNWQLGAGINLSDSGSTVTSANLGWQFRSVRYAFFANVSANSSEFDENGSESVSWDATAQYSHDDLSFSVRLEQSQTDAISFFEIANIESSVEQQSLVAVDQLTLNFSGINPIDSLTLSLSYFIGESQNVLSVDAIEFSDENSISYQQASLTAVLELGSSSSVTAILTDRLEDESETRSLAMFYSNSINSKWSAHAGLQKNLIEVDRPLGWSASINYAF